jgi:hypothetical protein
VLPLPLARDGQFVRRDQQQPIDARKADAKRCGVIEVDPAPVGKAGRAGTRDHPRAYVAERAYDKAAECAARAGHQNGWSRHELSNCYMVSYRD